MKVHVLKRIMVAKGTKVVTLQPNETTELPDAIAEEYLRKGAVERYETKVIRQDPLPDAGEDTPSSASPAAPASTETTSEESSNGDSEVTATEEQTETEEQPAAPASTETTKGKGKGSKKQS